MREIWKPVAGWPYAVSDQGRIMRLIVPQRYSTRGSNTYAGKILKSHLYGCYLRVKLFKPSSSSILPVSRLVWEAFNGPIPDGLEINHINGLKTDNCLENLEVVTHSENMLHSFRIGLQDNRGINHPQAKLTEMDVLLIRQRFDSGETQASIARDYEVTRQAIWRIIHGKNWKYT